MKYIKTYENNEIKINDYVVLKRNSIDPHSKHLEDVVGILDGIYKVGDSKLNLYNIYFGDAQGVYVQKSCIDFYSKNKEDAELFLQTRNYNL